MIACANNNSEVYNHYPYYSSSLSLSGNSSNSSRNSDGSLSDDSISPQHSYQHTNGLFQTMYQLPGHYLYNDYEFTSYYNNYYHLRSPFYSSDESESSFNSTPSTVLTLPSTELSSQSKFKTPSSLQTTMPSIDDNKRTVSVIMKIENEQIMEVKTNEIQEHLIKESEDNICRWKNCFR